MAAMQSRHVNITERQYSVLKAYADGKQISLSEAFRRIIDEWMDKNIQYISVTNTTTQ
jgi:hypothetical protein